jgi:menaquinone-dependent protoporphyrinogen oxidase
MAVLVTWGSKRGGTKGLAEMLAADLREDGLEVVMTAPGDVHHFDHYDAVIVGGSLYANRWHRDARRFVKRHAAELRRRPTWFFSSGPLDDRASATEIPPVKAVQELMDQVGARGHATFGGRLTPDAKGFVAGKMAKKYAGDWRDAGQVRAWADEVASELRAGVRSGA